MLQITYFRNDHTHIKSLFISVMTAKNRRLVNQKTEKYKTIAQNPAKKKMLDKSFNPPLILSKLT